MEEKTLHLTLSELKMLLSEQRGITIERICDTIRTKQQHNIATLIDLADIRNTKCDYPNDVMILDKYLAK